MSKLVSQTNSGEASVLRFCRTLGLSGFREFRVALPGRLSDKARRLTQHLATELACKTGNCEPERGLPTFG
ncbi:MAG: hypothetical protein EOS32_02810 [Mesorhizobium sp.]|nr:MAG: hypothetical protein EOS32_02810 [Mesorhizobium sp.]